MDKNAYILPFLLVQTFFFVVRPKKHQQLPVLVVMPQSILIFCQTGLGSLLLCYLQVSPYSLWGLSQDFSQGHLGTFRPLTLCNLKSESLYAFGMEISRNFNKGLALPLDLPKTSHVFTVFLMLVLCVSPVGNTQQHTPSPTLLTTWQLL